MNEILLNRRRCMGGIKRSFLCISMADRESGVNRVHFVNSNMKTTPVIYYSTDLKNWIKWTDLTQYIPLEQPIYLYGDNKNILSSSANAYWNIRVESNTIDSPKIKVSGDITSIIGWSEKIKTYAFAYLFKNNIALIDASELDLSNVKSIDGRREFYSMFASCKSLLYPPELPKLKSLSESTYASMFLNCSSLQYAPEITSRTLFLGIHGRKDWALYNMFTGCPLIKRVVCLMEEKSPEMTTNWLNSVSQTSDCVFVRSKNVSEDFWPRGVSGIPTNWTVEVEP